MNYNLSELVYILDMSGSMHHLRNDTIGGYNAMIGEQKKLGEKDKNIKANVTTVLFDDRYIVLHDREDIDHVKELTDKEYCPTGSTAMLDAIGKTVVSVGQKLAAMPEAERPGLVSVTIITDGMENASKEYDWTTIRNMIKEQREKYSWVFSFIGANIDVEKTSYDLGIDSTFAKTYTASSTGVASVYCNLATGQTNLREAITVDCANVMDTATSTLARALDNIQ